MEVAMGLLWAVGGCGFAVGSGDGCRLWVAVEVAVGLLVVLQFFK